MRQSAQCSRALPKMAEALVLRGQSNRQTMRSAEDGRLWKARPMRTRRSGKHTVHARGMLPNLGSGTQKGAKFFFSVLCTALVPLYYSLGTELYRSSQVSAGRSGPHKQSSRSL